MVLFGIITITTILLLLIIGFALVRINYTLDIQDISSSIDIMSLPIVKFSIGDKDLNFLIDSGATDNHINGSLIETLDPNHCVATNKIAPVNGLEGNAVDYRIYNLQLFDGKSYYQDAFSATDLNAAFKIIEEESGVTIHGILGNSFMKKYNCKLNYKNKTFKI